MKQFFTKHYLMLFILLLALVLRLYRVTNPVLDWHSWRQADTASVTREYVKNGINFLEPKYHDLSNIPSGKDNLEGYRMVEFPIYNALVAFLVINIPGLNLDITSRVVSIIFSLGTLISLYYLTKTFYGKKMGYLTAFFFAVIPYSIYYSRVILPEPILVFFSTFALTTFVYYLKYNKNSHYFLSIASLALAFLMKPFTVFLAPVFLAVLFNFKKIKEILLDYKLYFLLIISLLPILAWRKHITSYPEGIPSSNWLFNDGFHGAEGVRFKPYWYRWLFYERLTKLILGFVGAIPAAFGLIYALIKKEAIIISWWLGILIYFIVIARGNVQHDYYQALTIPIVALTVARGVIAIDQLVTKFTNSIAAILTNLVLISLMLFFSWQQVKGYFNVNHWEHLKAGQAVDRLVPKDALVIAPLDGDTAFLYQTNRRGWPIGYEIEDKIKKGATIYVTTSMNDEAQTLEKKYHIIEKTKDYLILDLTKTKE